MKNIIDGGAGSSVWKGGSGLSVCRRLIKEMLLMPVKESVYRILP